MWVHWRVDKVQQSPKPESFASVLAISPAGHYFRRSLLFPIHRFVLKSDQPLRAHSNAM